MGGEFRGRQDTGRSTSDGPHAKPVAGAPELVALGPRLNIPQLLHFMTTASVTFDRTELQRLLSAREPTAFLVHPRLLRRLIKQDRDISGLGLQVPHYPCYVTTRDSVLGAIDSSELELPADAELPSICILIAAPSPRELARMPRAQSLLKVWRTLFHARVHVELDRRLAHLHSDDWRARIERVGATEFDEVRQVLRQDRRLLPPADERETYVEFAATYLELHYFARPLLPHYFPGLEPGGPVDDLLAEDVNADQLFRDTHIDGAAPPEVVDEPPDDKDDTELAVDFMSVLEDGQLPGVLGNLVARVRGEAGPGRFRALIRRAKKASRRGNHVRAAISRMQASRVAPPERTEETRASAFAELDQLATRLQVALGLDPRDRGRWRRGLRSLLEPASRGWLPAEARLLHDLQKACLDYEHELYTTDLVDWAISLGRRPIRRALPCERLVLRGRHLRTAARRLRSARLSDTDRARLAALFKTAVNRLRDDTRARLRPVIRSTLEEVGMRPANLPERAAANKLTEELLDRIDDQGFLTMGDLRDAVSRNNLKLPDLGRDDPPAWTERFGPVLGRLLAGAREFWQGDRLLRADRRLAVALDGVYRRGEIYLRWLQRLSSVAFGTRTGRFLTLYAALPFGGAFMLLFMCLEIRGYGRWFGHLLGLVSRTRPLTEEHEVHIHWPAPWGVALLGLFFLGLLHWPAFRRAIAYGFVGAGRGLRWLFVDFPVLVRGLPSVRWVLDSMLVMLLRRYVMKPLLCAVVAGLVLRSLDMDLLTIAVLGGATFLTTGVFFNTRLGRDVEEATTDWLVRVWQRLHFDLIPGLVRAVLGFFKRLLERLDRFFYRVDEWLRFRSGDRVAWQIAKPILGAVWFFIAYVVRFFVNVLIEPQINPIKHFPVVTVSHKLVLALFVPPFSQFLMDFFGYERAKALATAFSIGLMPPGLFGFLVWELKENWRLYRANQPPELQPVAIGHHGETMIRLLRPGLHSGTLPKLYARLRKSGQTAYRDGDWRAFRKQREALHHLEDAVQAFVDRDVAFLLNQSKCWGPAKVQAGAVSLGTNRVRLELSCPELDRRGLEVAFEECDGWLRAAIVDPGWLPRLSPDQRGALIASLAGLYKMAGVDVVSPCRSADAGPYGACVKDDRSVQWREASLPWPDWVATWQAEQCGLTVPLSLVNGAPLLPEPQESAETACQEANGRALKRTQRSEVSD